MSAQATEGGRVGPILIFPGGMPRSIEYLQHCQRNRLPVIGASSLGFDPAREQYPDWAILPYVTDPGFAAALKDLIESRRISGIFSPNPVVWNYLNSSMEALGIETSLVNASPADAELASFREAAQRAKRLRGGALQLPGSDEARPAASEIELAALYRHFDVIPGMCDHDKLVALHEVVRGGVSGDLVEIGSWWGKSAFLLTRLAQLYGIGKLLCVDPWANEHLVQNDDTGMVDAGSLTLDASEAFQVFLMNLAPYATGSTNYLRMPSVLGAQRYADRAPVTSETFGAVEYAGSIALLHIDGNHSYEAAKADVQAWTPHVAAGGWIVVDDYIWPYGDGPQRAGDEFLDEHASKIDSAFVMGSALFVRLSEPL